MKTPSESNYATLVPGDNSEEIQRERVAFYYFMSMVDSRGFEFAAGHDNVC
jgi:hypothetical protein